jgi:hypothetical protein
MSGKTVQRDRQISSKLVHIEQVIGLAKSFKILTLASNRTEAKLVSDISFVVVQFKKKCIIPLFKLNYFIIESKLLYQRRHDTLVSCATIYMLLNRKSASIYRYLMSIMRVTLSNFQCFTRPITAFMDD